MARHKTKYPGVFYREAKRHTGGGTEKVFYVVFKRDGKVVEEKAGRQFADDMTAARAAGVRAELMEGKRLTRKEQREEAEAQKRRMTISKLWDEYKNQREMSKGLRTDDYRFKDYLAKPFGSKQPHEICTLDVDRVRVKLLKQKSPQTVKHVMALLKRVINFGVRKGLCQAPDPTRLHIELPRVDNEVTEDLNPEQLQRLLQAMDADENQQTARIMKMALATGMRRSEILRLQWDDVDLDRGFIFIRQSKGGKAAHIPMSDMSRGILQEQPRTSEYVFPNPEGGELQNIYPALRRIRKRAGLPNNFRPMHGLRHVYASMLASAGTVDMYTLQKLLTHKEPRMSQRYAHLRDEALSRAAGVHNDLMKAVNGEYFHLKNAKMKI